MARIEVALCLPAPDIEALLQGRLIVATPRLFIRPGRQFALCPSNTLLPFPVEQVYQSNFLSIAKLALDSSQPEKSLIKAWAKCEMCQEYRDSESLNTLSKLTIWTNGLLQKTLATNEKIFLSYLRVYLLDKPIEIPIKDEDRAKTFIPLPNYWLTTERTPVLSDAIFLERKQHLVNLEVPSHPELEDLYEAINDLAISDSETKEFKHDIERFLGWSNAKVRNYIDLDMAWIETISDVGNSSDGYTFEKLVRKSLIKLGFSNSRNDPKASLDPEATGGAGGIDFYCDAPYFIVGECKATKSEKVPSRTPGQLIQLGRNHLQENYDSCIKIIVAAGELTPDARLTTINNQMNVLRPETLQKLVETKTKYQGAIDLIDLKPYLERSPFGEEADDKVNKYIELTIQKLKTRSQIVRSVKQLTKPSKKQLEVTEISTCYNLFAEENKVPELDKQTLHELLIELSSPLTGYLGRIRGTSMDSDRFYFLRDLPMD